MSQQVDKIKSTAKKEHSHINITGVCWVMLRNNTNNLQQPLREMLLPCYSTSSRHAHYQELSMPQYITAADMYLDSFTAAVTL